MNGIQLKTLFDKKGMIIIMKYSVPRSKDELEAICKENGLSLPVSENTAEVLGQKLTIKNKTAHNRIVYQAMEGCDGMSTGEPDELTRRRYLRFANGGAGIIWFEATAVVNEGRANPRQLYITPENTDSFAKTVNDIKEECLKKNGYEPIVICQLTHSGRYSKPEGFPAPLIAYNNPIFEKDNPIDKSRILSDDQLDRISEKIIQGAMLAEKAGFDGADIKSCHRYLLCELLSAFTRENSKYGGCFENRTRLLLDSIKGAIAACGKDFIVTTRMNAYDGFEYPYGFGVNEGQGITPDFTEAKRLVKLLTEAGVPLINITMGNPYVNPHVNRPFAMGPYEQPEAPIAGVKRMLDGIAEIAAETNVPIISSGLSFLGSASADVAAGYIEQGGFAFAGYGRETLAYPDVAKDVVSGGSIAPSKMCITCGKCSEIMRKPGGTPGCVIRDGEVYAPIYKKLCT